MSTNEREALGHIISEHRHGSAVIWDEDARLADAILAAGWRRPRVVETEATEYRVFADDDEVDHAITVGNWRTRDRAVSEAEGYVDAEWGEVFLQKRTVTYGPWEFDEAFTPDAAEEADV